MSPALLSKILYWHVMPSLSAVILTTGFISLVALVFNVKSPRWLYWLFFIPLAKGLVVLTNGALTPPVVPTTKVFAFGMRLWDPLNMISIPSAFDKLPRVPTAIDQMTIGIISLLLLALVWRWASLFVFYRSLRGEELHAEEAPRLFRMLDTLVKKMHTRYPKVVVIDKPYVLPCLVGVFKPTIILSPELAEESSEDILRASLAHELAHLKRHDNLFHWIVVMLRDSLIWNPFVHLVFSRIMAAKEQDCDRIAVEATGKPRAMAEAIVHAAAVANKKGKKPLPGNLSGVTESISAGKLISRRIDILMAVTPTKKQKVHWAKVLILIVLLLLSFFLYLYVTWPPPQFSPIFQF